MFVIKRSGRREPVHFDKITSRISKLCFNLNNYFVEPTRVAQTVIQGLYDGVSTTEIDNLAAETAASMAVVHPDYAILAARIAVSNLHKNTSKSFSQTVEKLHTNKSPKTNEPAPLISDEVYEVIQKNKDRLDGAIIHHRDFNYDYFGFKTLERSYLMKVNGNIVERPQHMLMRVSVGIHKEDIDAAIETYNLMSEKWFTHATPTLFNAGTPKPQMSSCFLLSMKEDSIPGIYDTLKQCAEISQSAGGIGFSIHNIRAKGSYIKGTGGTSNGIVPMLRVFNDTARYVDQGGGKRKGAFAVYLEPWHADIFDFVELKKNHGKEEMRARDLFYALWIPDLFMKRVKENGTWSLFSPNETADLPELYGEEFEQKYEQYEKEGRALKTVKAQDLWFKILDSQIETGTPYMLYKDHVNRKSNQKNLGTIKSSNLCTEIVEYTSPDEVAVCNLGSINLSKFVQQNEDGTYSYDFDRLCEITMILTRNLNKVIDGNYYPVPEAKHSNLKHRPIGLGVQGLADAFLMMRLPFESDEAKQLNRDIFETIYFGAVTASMQLAKQDGAYESFKGSPISEGKFQFDLWDVQPGDRWDWEGLRKNVLKHGVRNSLLVAPMPTASTSQILGNNECFEPYTSNIYSRRTLSGEYVVVNKHLLKDLNHLGIWSEELKNAIVQNNGSIQNIHGIPDELKQLYKTSWEIKQKRLIELSADRGAFIDQSQSLNVFIQDANYSKLTSMHFYGWEKGLKTGMYYLRTRPAADPIKFTIDMSKANKYLVNTGDELVQPNQPSMFQQAPVQAAPQVSNSLGENAPKACSIDDPDCESCSG